MRRSGKFYGKIKYDNITIMEFKDITFDEMTKRMDILKRKFG